MHTHLVLLRLSACLGFCAASAWAQISPSDNTPADAPVGQASPSTTSAWGLGLFHYTEPGVMQLTGPEAKLQWRSQPTASGWPDSVQVDLGAASLAYRSNGTGSMNAVPALSGRGTTLWHLHVNEEATWRAGLQLDLVWTDLRGTTTVSDQTYRGYRRLGSKAWAVLERESADGARIQVGALLQGRQDSLLSDTGARDISNTQRSGLYLAYQHHAMGALALRPWLRYTQIGTSAHDGPYFEPRNRTLQLGALIDW